MDRCSALAVVILIYLRSHDVVCREYRLGYLAHEAGSLGWGTSAASTTMAIERAHKDGILGNNTIRILLKDANRDISLFMGQTIDLYENHKVDGFIGMPYSDVTKQIGYLMTFWNLPMLSQAGADPVLQDKATFKTLLRLMPPTNKVGNAVAELVKYFDWKRILLISRSSNMCQFFTSAVFQALSELHVTVPSWIKYGIELEEEKIVQILETITNKARIVYFCGNASSRKTFLTRIVRANLATGEYVYILSPYRTDTTKTYEPWRDTSDPEHEILREAGKAVIQLTLYDPDQSEFDQFKEEHEIKMAEVWNYNMTAHNRETSHRAVFLHDATYLYALALNKTLEAGQDPRNGTLFMQTAKQLTFQGLSGVVALDENGDRQPIFSFWYLKDDDNSSVLWAVAILSNDPGKIMVIREDIRWRTEDGKPPKDVPVCGFSGEHCVESEEDTMVIVIPVVVFGLLVLFCISGLILYLRKQKQNQQLNEVLWRINNEELRFIDSTKFSVHSMASLKLGEGNSDRGPSLRGSKVSSMNSSMDSVERCQIFTRVAMYRGQMVSVKSVNIVNSLVQRDQDELKTMRIMKHDNVNRFVGACVDTANPCILTAYCSKGSLQDLLEHDIIKLDGIFKESLLFDIVNGMLYLHSTQLKSHGNLNSSNCIIDSRWVLKVTDFYPSCATPRVTDQIGEYELYRAKLWTAPELLRSLPLACRGSQPGDVYSFAIVLQEVLFRALPFFMENISPKDIIARVREGSSPPFRPQCPIVSTVKPEFLQLMRACWIENPQERPTFSDVKKSLEEISDRGKVTVMDRILQKLETYSTNLEEIVHDRTKALREEKSKTDTLLYQMLPSTIADKLKQGENVSPELYEEATIYFSDIVGFVELSSESSPFEVTILLNELYELLDKIAANYKVYKVETIGDSYMVVSGIPERIGHRHVTEMADMSLHILRSAMAFQIRHRPGQRLQLRIGLHTGACCAGILGLAMPRYCLFGDTVNTASRMESNGEGLKIHISREMYLALKSFSGYIMSERGEINIKGKGKLRTYWLEGKDNIDMYLE